MTVNNVTPNRSYKEPHEDNDLEDDIGRLVDTFRAIDTDVATLIASLTGKAPLASPTLTGVPTAPTAALGTDTGQLATTAFVAAAITALIGGAPGALDTLNEIAAAIGDDDDIAGTLTAAIAARLEKSQNLADLPNKPTARTNLGVGYANAAERAAFQTAIGVPSPRPNLIVNPRMQISQENGNSSGTTNGYHAADQWPVYHVSSAGTITRQRVQSVTPRGSKDRLRVNITTADASLAAGEYLVVMQSIEGNRVAHLKWGTAGAVPVVLRFGFKGPAGTYAVVLQNSSQVRNYPKTFTISAGQANTDTEHTIVIPGDTAGTWLKDNGIGIILAFTLAVGTNFHGADGAWAAGGNFGTSAVSNGMASNTNVFEIFDVGLYADPDGLGIAPDWTPMSEAFDLRECQRYYWKGDQSNANYNLAGPDQIMFLGSVGGTGHDVGASLWFPTEMRVAPTVTRSSMVAIGFPSLAQSTVSKPTGVTEVRRSNSAGGNYYWITAIIANARF